MRSASTVAIIGGGYAGLAAAVRLSELGIPSTVFEAGPVLGGRARRIAYRDTTLDNGQHILSGAYSALLRLMKLVGVNENAMRRVPLTLDIPPHFSLRAPRLPAPLHLAWALCTAKGLDWPARRAAIAFMQSLKRSRFVVHPAWTVDRLLSEHKQPATLIEWLWKPLTVSALNTPTDIASAQVFANVLRDALASSREASDLLLPMVDLSALFPEAAARWLVPRGSDVLTGRRITALAATDSGFTVSCADGSQDFARAIVAVGPHQIDALGLAGLAGPAFDYQPIYTVYLQYPASVRMPYPMAGQTQGLTQWFFDRGELSTASPEQAPHGLIAAVISAAGEHEQLDNTDLAGRVHDELVAAIGPLPSPLWHKVIAEKFATFSCTPLLARPEALTAVKHCYLAGDYVAGDYPATLEGAARNGIRAAELAAASLLVP